MGGAGMPPIPNNQKTQTFILRIYREDREVADAESVWRGVIEILPDGEKRYVKNKEEILAFIVQHMQKIGLKL
jgi:hypothetical protein